MEPIHPFSVHLDTLKWELFRNCTSTFHKYRLLSSVKHWHQDWSHPYLLSRCSSWISRRMTIPLSILAPVLLVYRPSSNSLVSFVLDLLQVVRACIFADPSLNFTSLHRSSSQSHQSTHSNSWSKSDSFLFAPRGFLPWYFQLSNFGLFTKLTVMGSTEGPNPGSTVGFLSLIYLHEEAQNCRIYWELHRGCPYFDLQKWALSK